MEQTGYACVVGRGLGHAGYKSGGQTKSAQRRGSREDSDREYRTQGISLDRLSLYDRVLEKASLGR